MNHYVYLIEQKNALPNQAKYYIGVRSCETLIWDDQEYMGSSKYLTEDIEKNGKHNYNKIILKRFDDRESALAHEIELHKEFDVANNPIFFNKSRQTSVKFAAGAGKNNHFFGKKHTEKSRQLMSEILKTKNCLQKTNNLGKKFPQAGPKISAIKKEYYKTHRGTTLGFKFTDEQKENVSRAALSRPKYKCLHCDVVTTSCNLARWHNDNCQNKGE